MTFRVLVLNQGADRKITGAESFCSLFGADELLLR